LTDNQKRDVTAIFERMSTAAKPPGGALIAGNVGKSPAG